MIDKKYGKETTPADYDTTGGDYDMGIEGHVKDHTGKNISGSTLERLVGLREKENKGVSVSTLKIVPEYLGFSSYDKLLNYMEFHSASKTESTIRFDIADILRQHSMRISFNEDMFLVIRYQNENIFEVLSSDNMKLHRGDKLEVLQLHSGEELVCARVTRQNKKRKSISLGKYKSGTSNPIQSIELIKEQP